MGPTAPRRGVHEGVGFDDDALSRPTIGIANTWTEAMPCNFHLRRLAEHIKDEFAPRAARRWSSTPSLSPTGSRWGPRG